MSEYKRVWAVLGVVGLLGALLALSAVSPTPAGAVTGPDNVVTLTKIVNGTYDGSGSGFTLGVFCEDPDDNAVEDTVPPIGPDTSVDFEGGGTVGTNGGTIDVSIPAWHTE